VLVVAITLPWVLWALVRTVGLDAGYPLVAIVTFTPYAAVTALVPLALALALREWLVGAVAALALAALVAAVAPRAFGGADGAAAHAGGQRLVVMSANLRFGEADAESLLALVREHHVDLLSLQELTPAAVRRLDAAGARTLLPGRALAARSRAAGTGLMARRPLRLLVEPVAEGRAQLRAALQLSGGVQLRVVAVHPYPPVSRGSEHAWQEVLRALPGASDGGRPHLLVGDFNATLDHRELRRVIDRGYVDAADATGGGLRPTFPVGHRYPPITIDHVLVERSIAVRRLSVHPIAGSDHRAIIAELVLPAG
jgi:endonuclease/exonuclease/phosphatase (EEP) superfamily protein YafD